MLWNESKEISTCSNWLTAEGPGLGKCFIVLVLSPVTNVYKATLFMFKYLTQKDGNNNFKVSKF